jgi:hypothetical protein
VLVLDSVLPALDVVPAHPEIPSKTHKLPAKTTSDTFEIFFMRAPLIMSKVPLIHNVSLRIKKRAVEYFIFKMPQINMA